MSTHGKHNLPKPEIHFADDGYRGGEGKFDPLAGTETTGRMKVISSKRIGEYHLVTATNGPGSGGNSETLYAVPTTSRKIIRRGANLRVKLIGIEEVPHAGGFRNDAPARLMVVNVLPLRRLRGRGLG